MLTNAPAKDPLGGLAISMFLSALSWFSAGIILNSQNFLIFQV
jgi:hypothetical protein